MADILEEIVAHKRIEVERFKQELSEQEIHRRVEPLLDFSVASMSQALTASDSGIIAEFKRKSPSKGWIKEDGRADIIPLSYQQNGAAALSIGASAVLLIAADLSVQQCSALLKTAHDLGLEVLLEMHLEKELDYVALEPDMCGINNRNLGSFVTDVQNSFRLAELLPKDAVKVSESGISNPDTVKALRQAGFRGFLIGENFMKTADPGTALHEFINQL